MLSSELLVQREYNGEWRDETTDLRLIEKCGEAPGECRNLAHAETLQPVAWNGLVCASQCSASCRANLNRGPGRFRFIVQSCNRKLRAVGPAFNMPGPSAPKN